jgi:hypothetical protein
MIVLVPRLYQMQWLYCHDSVCESVPREAEVGSIYITPPASYAPLLLGVHTVSKRDICGFARSRTFMFMYCIYFESTIQQ